MQVMAKQIRIKNFRSLASVDVTLSMTNVLIGQNNSGKSNFLKAVDIALGGNRVISEDDIYISKDEKLTLEKVAIIDILLIPIDNNENRIKQFTDFWTSVFTDKWITTDETNGDFVGIRTLVEFNIKRNDYSIVRKPIIEWNSSLEESKTGKKQQFGIDIMEYVNSFFMDAQRDVTEDIQNKKSYFGRATSLTDLSDELITKLETQLNDVNSEIIRNIPALQQTTDKMAAIGKTLGNTESSIQIEPLTRKISDLHKGMDVSFRDGTAASFSISQHGMGTRSWISFLTLGAYIDWISEKMKKDDDQSENFIMLTMEEPEAHLHPHAQRLLYSQIVEFNGQKIISTHSPNVVAQAEIADIVHIYKNEGVTRINRFISEEYIAEEISRIKREVIITRGELLFSQAIVLCEGITEEQALPIFFKEYFGTEPVFRGINIIGIGGQNYKTFLNLIKNFGIKWFIFSDGEKAVLKSLVNAVAVITPDDIKTLKNVIVLENLENYEKHLISSGYGKMMIDAMNKCEGKKMFFNDSLKIIDNTNGGRKKSSKPPCKTCKQDIYEDNIRNYDGAEGKNRAIYDCCTRKNAKSKYAIGIAEEIISQNNGINKIPPKIKILFDEMKQQLNLEVRREYDET